MKHAAGGIGLVGVLIVAGALYFTGAGAWMLTSMQGLSQNCYRLVPSFAASAGSKACTVLARGVDVVSDASGKAGAFMQSLRDRFQSGISSSVDMGGIENAFQRSLAGLASPADALNQMVQRGPQPYGGGSITQQFQQAVDSFTIGQRYMHSGGMERALPWLQHSARQPQGFGVMSQLSLGNIYSRGGSGVKPDAVQAQAYYRLAFDSLSVLNASNSPQARQILQGLPASPRVMQQQIIEEMRRLQK